MAGQRMFPWSWVVSPVHRHTLDPFFSDGDAACWGNRKQFVARTLQEEDEEWEEAEASSSASAKKCFPCQAAGCRSIFTTVSQYELHYNSAHRHRCSECRHAFPTDRLLYIHISEWHDPLFDLDPVSSKYRCLLEVCTEKFTSHEKRKDHLITAHKFPANFRFAKPPKSKPHRKTTNPANTRRNAETNSEKMETESFSEAVPKMPHSLADLARVCLKQEPNKNSRHLSSPGGKPPQDNLSLSAVNNISDGDGYNRLNTVSKDDSMETSQDFQEKPARRFVYRANIPKNICFGAGSQRGFQHGKRGVRRGGGKKSHWHQRGAEDRDTTVDIQEVDMEELSTALDPS